MANSIDHTTAALVCQAMEERGVSQLKLAEVTRIPRTTLMRRLAGDSSFTVNELDRIAAALSIDAPALLNGAVVAA